MVNTLCQLSYTTLKPELANKIIQFTSESRAFMEMRYVAYNIKVSI